MTGQLHASVAGGGIAGLTAALSLAQADWQVTVLERAPAFGEIGAGLALTANALAALSAIGQDEPVRQAGYTVYIAGTQDQDGRWLIRRPDGHPELTPVVTLCAIHRQRLHAALLKAAHSAENIELITGAAVTSVRPGVAGGAQAQITWHQSVADYPTDAEHPADTPHTPGADRATSADTTGADHTTSADHTTDVEHIAETGLIVAADGVRSAVRTQLFPNVRPHYSGSTSWRAIVADTATGDQFAQMWGPETEFGALRISPDEVYWYGYFRHPENTPFTDELTAAGDHFRTWSRQVRDLIAATSPDRLMRHDVYHLGAALPRYTWGRVVLIGDAAHAVLPTMGQGAASAIEDGVCVGRLIAAPIAAGHDMAAAMNAFDQARRPRCQHIARMSLLTGRFGADLGGGWRQTARNQLLRFVPAAAALRTGMAIVTWTPPTATADTPPAASPETRPAASPGTPPATSPGTRPAASPAPGRAAPDRSSRRTVVVGARRAAAPPPISPAGR